MPKGLPLDSYEHEHNARILSQAEEIKSDKKKMAGAKKAAARMVKEETKRLKGLKKVAKKK